MNRAVALRIAACGIIGLGAALLIAALLLTTYTTSRITKIPLDLDATLVSTGEGTVLDPASLTAKPPADCPQAQAQAPTSCPLPTFVINDGVDLTLQQQFTVESPSDADVVTLQVGSTLRRSLMQDDAGLLLAIVDFVPIDRSTALAVNIEQNPAGVQPPRAIGDPKPPGNNTEIGHDGLTYRFPFNVEQTTYPYFDPIAQRAFDARFDGEEDVNGLTTYRFIQNIGYNADGALVEVKSPEGELLEPVPYPSLYDDKVDSVVTAPASQWGLPGNPARPVTLTRYYAAQRTFWVDPVSGTIVKSTERANHYYADPATPTEPTKTFADYSVTSDDKTVETQVAAARDERDRLALWGRILPITFIAIGVVALTGGGLLGWFTLRAESALIDPGLDSADHGFFSPREPAVQRVPGAEAETEKLPSQRPDAGPGPPDTFKR